jgi:hypothetical protein
VAGGFGACWGTNPQGIGEMLTKHKVCLITIDYETIIDAHETHVRPK